MNRSSKASRQILLIALLLMLVGCGESLSLEILGEEEDPIYRRAKQMIARDKNGEALENLLKLIQKRDGNAPESHLEAGRIYLNHLKDPVSAIWHFKRFKILKSGESLDGEDRRKVELVDDMVKTAMKALASTFEAKIYQDPLERMKLLDTIDLLRRENESLKEEHARLRAEALRPRAPLANVEPRPVSSVSDIEIRRLDPIRSPQSQEPLSEENGYYVIQEGDTLYKISRTVYGDGSRWQMILDANRDVIPNPNSLRVGAAISIP